MGIPGGVIAGVVALWIYTNRKKISFGLWLDNLAPGVALAQGIGRWGNFVNQELYGHPTTLPWGIKIDAAHGGNPALRYQPLFLYDFFFNLLITAILLIVSRKMGKKLKNGDIFILFAIIYSFGRFFLEFMKVDQSKLWGMGTNQLIMAVVFIGSLVLFVVRHLTKKESAEEVIE